MAAGTQHPLLATRRHPGPRFPARYPVPSQAPLHVQTSKMPEEESTRPSQGGLRWPGGSPIFSGLNAATTSRRGQAFQYRVEMARLGGWYLKCKGMDSLTSATLRSVTKSSRPGWHQQFNDRPIRQLSCGTGRQHVSRGRAAVDSRLRAGVEEARDTGVGFQRLTPGAAGCSPGGGRCTGSAQRRAAGPSPPSALPHLQRKGQSPFRGHPGTGFRPGTQRARRGWTQHQTEGRRD